MKVLDNVAQGNCVVEAGPQRIRPKLSLMDRQARLLGVCHRRRVRFQPLPLPARVGHPGQELAVAASHIEQAVYPGRGVVKVTYEMPRGAPSGWQRRDKSGTQFACRTTLVPEAVIEISVEKGFAQPRKARSRRGNPCDGCMRVVRLVGEPNGCLGRTGIQVCGAAVFAADQSPRARRAPVETIGEIRMEDVSLRSIADRAALNRLEPVCRPLRFLCGCVACLLRVRSGPPGLRS